MFSDDFSWDLGLENSPSTPTPPQSPESKPDVSLGFEIPISNVEMVNPNAVLDESHLFSDSLGLNFNLPSLNSSEDSLNTECWPLLSDDYFDSSCPHGFVPDLCNNCFTGNIKTEVLNDCMWPSGCEDIKLDRLSTSSSSETNVSGSLKSLLSRSHLDSVSSKYSEIMDPLIGVIANNSDDLNSHQEPVLDTPSDTSDTDTDLEDTCTAVENIHLEHNYHLNNNHMSSDLSYVFRKSHNDQVTKKQQINSVYYSDEEISVDEDSENSDSKSDTSQNCTPIVNHNFLSLGSTKNIIVNTNNINATDLQMLRKMERKTYIPRRVGRPSKNLKRAGNSYPNKRSGCRSVQMDPERRKVHNKMERLRRVNLKSDFDHIRNLVPSLIDRIRAPKVLILKSAVDFVYELKEEIQKMDIETLRLSHYNSILKQKFEMLKKEKGIIDIELG